MNRVLITGGTGNIGREVVHYLCELDPETKVFAAVRDVDRARRLLPDWTNLSFRHFNFDDRITFGSAFEDIDVLFLLRPPHISEVKKYFEPLLRAAKTSGIRKIVFLSVQGAEKSSVIPHNKIEKLIESYGFDHIFLRPSYFMQNLTTTLLPEIVEKNKITLPSGKARFNWIDVSNIGEAAAVLIRDFNTHQNTALEITGAENKNFYEVAQILSEHLDTSIRFNSINPVSFYLLKRSAGVKSGFALVMTILHFLPRFQADPEISDNFQSLTGKSPTTLKQFIKREREQFTSQ